jgi:hypothetical protein
LLSLERSAGSTALLEDFPGAGARSF